MSSFLINCMMMLITTFGLLSFLTINFESFLRDTACERLFKLLIKNSKLIKWLYYYKIFCWGTVIAFFLILGYLLTVPSKKSHVRFFVLIFLDKKANERKKERKSGYEYGC